MTFKVYENMFNFERIQEGKISKNSESKICIYIKDFFEASIRLNYLKIENI